MSVFNHIGLCVTDLERSKRFYVDVLGFEPEREIQPPDDPSAQLLSIAEPVNMTASYLLRDGLVLELLHFDRPGNPPAATRVMNEPGLTHISVSVDDFDAACAQVVEYGGSVIDESNIGGQAMMIRDPDGQLIELLPMGYRDAMKEAGYQ